MSDIEIEMETKLCLNPLKRVNSILTLYVIVINWEPNCKVSIPSNGSIQFLRSLPELTELRKTVSIPSNGSIQFLQWQSLL